VLHRQVGRDYIGTILHVRECQEGRVGQAERDALAVG
jgi:hypothetical protein